MKLATWNVNSIRARLPRVLAWLGREQPELLCMQEIKVEDGGFPIEAFVAAGYRVTTHGQKTYNGVAFASREEVREVERGMNDGVDDAQARFLSGRLRDVGIATVYVPNGQAVGSEKFEYKLRWMDRWRDWIQHRADLGEPWVFCGDINVAPEDRDVHDPEAWRDQLLCHPDERSALARIVQLGLVDVFRAHHAEAGLYSWWDYRQLGFPRNHGLRIDLILCSPALARRCTSVRIDRDERKGKGASDHAPVIAEFADS